ELAFDESGILGKALLPDITPMHRVDELLEVVRCEKQSPDDQVRGAVVRVRFVGAQGVDLSLDFVRLDVVEMAEGAPRTGQRRIERDGAAQVLLGALEQIGGLARIGNEVQQ